MRRNLTTAIMAIATAAMLASGNPARADDAAVHKELDAAYAKMSAATKRKDTAGVKAMFMPDIKIKDLTGPELSGDALKTALDSEFKAMKSFDTVKVTITSLTVKGSKATVTARSVASGTTAAAVDANGKEHKLIDDSVSTDTWVKTPKGWRMSRSVTTKDTATLDGKPFNKDA